MIKVEHLKKAFGPKLAVDGISFTVEKGEVLGFLGPNGAGKSTTMRMVTGYIPPDEGKITVGSYNLAEQPTAAKRLIGYLPENAPAYSDMTVRGFLSFAAEVRGLSGAARRSAVDRVIEMTFLESVKHQSVDTLSKGYKHRTCLAQSLLHDPEILILDEPTDGLDPNQKHEVRSLIKRMGANKVIIFSTHILEEVEAVCSRAIIIDRGRIVANGTPQELKNRAQNAGSVVVTVLDQTAEVLQSKLAALGSVRDAQIVTSNNSRVVARVFQKPEAAGSSLALTVSDLARSEGWRIEQLNLEEGRLDEVFRGITLSDTAKRKAA